MLAMRLTLFLFFFSDIFRFSEHCNYRKNLNWHLDISVEVCDRRLDWIVFARNEHSLLVYNSSSCCQYWYIYHKHAEIHWVSVQLRLCTKQLPFRPQYINHMCGGSYIVTKCCPHAISSPNRSTLLIAYSCTYH